MSAPTKGTSGNAAVSTGPINGSFPVDRLHECAIHIDSYFKCLQKHNHFASMCKKETRAYLECRRDNGLMTKRDFRDADVGDVDGAEIRTGRGTAEGLRDFEEWRRKREINKKLNPKANG